MRASSPAGTLAQMASAVNDRADYGSDESQKQGRGWKLFYRGAADLWGVSHRDFKKFQLLRKC